MRCEVCGVDSDRLFSDPRGQQVCEPCKVDLEQKAEVAPRAPKPKCVVVKERVCIAKPQVKVEQVDADRYIYGLNKKVVERRKCVERLCDVGALAATTNELLHTLLEAGYEATVDSTNGDLRLLGICRVVTWGRK